jgi:starvation-inducible DNA-binding protein
MPTTQTTGPTFQTRIDLSPDIRQKMIDLLNRELADTLDLYTQSKQAHWNVKGLEFFQLHELFDKVAKDAFDYIDMIAERVTALGGYAFGTARMAAQNSTLPEYPRDAIDGRQHLDAMIDRWGRYATAVRRAIDTAQNEDDMTTADLFTEISREVDKDLWFLEAHVQGATQKAG